MSKVQWLPEGTRLRMLRDQILLRPLDWSPSTIIKVAGSERRALRGVVVAIGPARRVKKYWLNAKGERYKMGDNGQTIQTEVKPGDVVEIGGLEIDGYRFEEVTIGAELHIICSERDVVGIDEDATGRLATFKDMQAAISPESMADFNRKMVVVV